ncbi:TetR/AcrR family transcriptional regulator [Catenibacterium mitsuokai]|uniref:TetR/AcrR family transcriptional regulator n=1 Tax=Catenibacterium mitsuokai TaxID=100886 RepID=UPI0011CBD669|nr:TetR family transcriptional regulator [Catenibacterium mitsuokai]
MDKKTDRRVLKTKRAIYNAFVELLSEKEINHITITDISKKADINRKTFYNYYSNTYEVMEEIENLTVDTFIKRLDAIEFTNMTDFLTEIFSQFTEIINSDLDFFSHLFCKSQYKNVGFGQYKNVGFPTFLYWLFSLHLL